MSNTLVVNMIRLASTLSQLCRRDVHTLTVSAGNTKLTFTQVQYPFLSQSRVIGKRSGTGFLLDTLVCKSTVKIYLFEQIAPSQINIFTLQDY